MEHAKTKRDLEQIGWIVRGILGKPEVSTDSGEETLTVRGMTDKLALVEWLIAEFDRPVHPPGGHELGVHQFRVPTAQTTWCE
jgi:hypothetical protein